ncbi:MAG: indole-3-glycerol phosphate synthase TrpC [SAR202 cluster bacterium]|nr:indole-3-glycerol phosphate synthase TrpC [SAR202 cluster bacterium]|tara:strand:- start:17365 stop:18153 length:789 start_codon:yes stop_codon:yes gene_type:complete
MKIPDILQEIVEAKRKELESQKQNLPLDRLADRVTQQPRPLNFSGALLGSSLRVIAEIKKRSPAKGDLASNVDVSKLASIYCCNGAAAISVLTNSDHFGGSIDDLRIVAEIAHQERIPVLRKEFIFDPYQVFEARANGADAILLIASMLTLKEMQNLKEVADGLWMQAIFEVHDEQELKKVLDCNAEIIGINNRNLHTFVTDIAVTERLAPSIPKGKIIVSESGISGVEDMSRIAAAGANCVLVGETLVTADDPGLMLRRLV